VAAADFQNCCEIGRFTLELILSIFHVPFLLLSSLHCIILRCDVPVFRLITDCEETNTKAIALIKFTGNGKHADADDVDVTKT